jgi:hypothetical protein
VFSRYNRGVTKRIGRELRGALGIAALAILASTRLALADPLVVAAGDIACRSPRRQLQRRQRHRCAAGLPHEGDLRSRGGAGRGAIAGDPAAVLVLGRQPV